jgi:flavin-dependent dehydrogenase
MFPGLALISIAPNAINVKSADAIVVGGGPAGSSCAWKLRAAGMHVMVLDRCDFPRTKLCAGWVTPEAMSDLELDEQEYQRSFMTFDKLYLHWKLITVKHRSRQHSVRRFEFDDFLLKRSGAEVVRHKVRKIEASNGGYLIDDQYHCDYLVGAGGTACPVYRELFHAHNPRAGYLQTATYEHEFAYPWENGECHLWFFNDGLPGYAWYVPKANGYLNVGLGGMALRLKEQGGHVREYWRLFVDMLNARRFLHFDDFHPKGYSYYLRGNVEHVRRDNAYIVGDAVGLATLDMCEGIGPAIRSGILAAQSILGEADYSLADMSKYSGTSVVSKLLEKGFVAKH